MRTLEKVVRDISEILRKLEIDYVIVGGIAVAGWGNVRTTRDVDIIMELERKNIGKLKDALKKKGFETTTEDIKDAIKEKSHFTIFDTKSDYHIDAKGCYSEKERRSLKTKKAAMLGGANIFIRQAGKLDMRYLEKICKEMRVFKKLEKLRKKVSEAL